MCAPLKSLLICYYSLYATIYNMGGVKLDILFIIIGDYYSILLSMSRKKLSLTFS
jgi:hypothetical protein